MQLADFSQNGFIEYSDSLVDAPTFQPIAFIQDLLTNGEAIAGFNIRGGAGGTFRFADSDQIRLSIDYTATSVPEPSTLLLLGSGLAGLAVFRKRFK